MKNNINVSEKYLNFAALHIKSAKPKNLIIIAIMKNGTSFPLLIWII